MKDFESDLKKHLASNGDYDPERGKKARRECSKEFDRKLLWTEIGTMLLILVLLFIAALEFHLLLGAHDIKSVILFALALVVVIETIPVAKLCYWVINTKLNIMREIKQLRIEIRDLSIAVRGPSENWDERIEDSDGWVGVGVPIWGRWIYSLGFTALAVFLFILAANGGYENALITLTSSPYVGKQTDEWTPFLEDRVEVVSTLELVKWPTPTLPMNIRFPYSRGRLSSALQDGKPLEFEETGQGEYRLRLAEPLAKDTRLMFQWSFPFKDLEERREGWRAELKTLIPTTSYKLFVLVDEESGLVSREDMEGSRLAPFSAQSSPQVIYGTCGLLVKKKGGEDAGPN
jgi:hypothetical protein